MNHHRHSPQETVQSSWNAAHVSDPGYSTQLWGLLVPDAGLSHETYRGNSPLLSMTRQHGSGDLHPTVGQVGATVNIYNPVIANSSNHQASTLSWLDEIYPTSVDDNAHQRPIMALSSLPNIFPGPQTRVEVPDSKIAVQEDSMADGAQRNTHFDSDTSQTDDQTLNESRDITEVVSNSSDHERYKTEEPQFPMMHFGAKLLPDDCSYLPTSFKCSTSGSRRLHTKPEEANRASQTHNEGEQLGEPRRRTCSFAHDMRSDK
ncbi:hypothetical protein EDB84DRAFT_981329 [Lactarius hengduanensis]|nr:hypothetical protein EDB84DRAFT_981329 [Lactarius hengduanensis]